MSIKENVYLSDRKAPDCESDLYFIAEELEQNEELNIEISEWDQEFINDGLENL